MQFTTYCYSLTKDFYSLFFHCVVICLAKINFSTIQKSFFKIFIIFFISIINTIFAIHQTTYKMERLKPGRKPINDKDKVKMCSAYLKLSEKQAINKKYESLTNAVRTLILPTLKLN